MSSDLAKILRLLKPQKVTVLARRSDAELPFLGPATLVGPPLMLDTCVYLDVLQGQAPPMLKLLLNNRHVFHSSVCLAELVHVFGRLDPADPRTGSTLAALENLIEQDIPTHRLSAPDVTAWTIAGVLAGVVSRMNGYKPAERQRCLNDALIFAQAAHMGCIVLTRNIRDFDFLQQLLAKGGVLLYRRLTGECA